MRVTTITTKMKRMVTKLPPAIAFKRYDIRIFICLFIYKYIFFIFDTIYIFAIENYFLLKPAKL